MKGDKVSGIREGDEVFISYLDDSGHAISGFAILVSISDTLLEFRNKTNAIIIPTSRLLKLKRRVQDAD